ncbi:FkbM family methyltransferase [Paracoccus lutimaris]|uniref:FkbM family methyltransferase n=1 Tax=Paracoccus lutimaris TaxID=1490030 RepID=A0A368YT02_9RHOB|nr:FkbM family methyltransferase [Paracoccus lutimaris]RCW83350.1 FkbM family methyltransferase [Paracoccus lutimaris]
MTEADVIEAAPFDAARALRTYTLRGRINMPAGQVAVFRHNDIEVMFAVVNDHDVVQRAHSKSNFYERDDLDVIARYFPRDGVFADIGANVGNHSVFAGMIMGASKIIPFEPNPIAQEIFVANMILNRMIDRVDFSFFTYGLSDKMDEGLAMRWNPNNLGGGRIVRSDSAVGNVVVIRGDDAFKDLHVDFLKIDVEGLELEVLDGLRETITRLRPTIFIEIDNRNADAFLKWVEANGYRIAERIRHYAVNENFLIIPQEQQ